MKQLNKYLFILLFPILTFTYPSKAKAETLTLEPIRDTFISANRPDAQGSADFLIVETKTGTGSYTSYVYLQFDLSSLPSKSEVTNASLKLSLKEYGETPACKIEITRATAPWRETEAYLGGPGNGDTSSTVAELVQNQSSMSWNITPFVTKWLSGEAENNGFVASAPDNCLKSFYSREASNTSHRPHLIIAYTPSATPTPTPSASPTPKASPKTSPTPKATASISPSETSTPMPVTQIVATPTPLQETSTTTKASTPQLVWIGLIVAGIIATGLSLHLGLKFATKSNNTLMPVNTIKTESTEILPEVNNDLKAEYERHNQSGN